MHCFTSHEGAGGLQQGPLWLTTCTKRLALLKEKNILLMNFRSVLLQAFGSLLSPVWMGTSAGGRQSRHRVVGVAVTPEEQRVSLHFPPAVPAPTSWEQIVGCAWCSWPLPDVSLHVTAIDGWSKNSPCFPVYAHRLPLRSSWIKTARLDKIAFLFIALWASMAMVERGQADLNCLLATMGRVIWGGFAEGGCFWPSQCPRLYYTPLHLDPTSWEIMKEKKVLFLSVWHPRLLPPSSSQLVCWTGFWEGVFSNMTRERHFHREEGC